MPTIFTKIANGQIPSWRVAQDENYYAFLDINPVVKGHVLVIPKRLEEDLEWRCLIPTYILFR